MFLNYFNMLMLRINIFIFKKTITIPKIIITIIIFYYVKYVRVYIQYYVNCSVLHI
jgi:hypothetical protein